jgi:hypothetical protein
MTPQPISQPTFREPLSLKPLTPQQIAALIQTIDGWIADESSDDEATYTQLLQSLDRDRRYSSARRMTP